MLTHAWNPGQTAGVTSGLHLVLSPCCSPTILTPCCSAMLFWHVVRACCSFSKSSTHSRRHAAHSARCATSCLGNHHNLGLGGRRGGCAVTHRPPRLVCPSHPRQSAVAHRPRTVRSCAPGTTTCLATVSRRTSARLPPVKAPSLAAHPTASVRLVQGKAPRLVGPVETGLDDAVPWSSNETSHGGRSVPRTHNRVELFQKFAS